MAKKRQLNREADRKRRTREHILEDRSLHFVKGVILRAGYTMEEVTKDYGLDLWMQTYNDFGEVEEDAIWMQVKATETTTPYALNEEASFSYPVETKDIRLWTSSFFSVYFILYDETNQEAYWFNTDEVLQGEQILTGKRKRLRIPRANVLGVQTIRLMREHRNAQIRAYREARKENRNA